MSQTHAFHDVARLPAPGDNVAVATRRLEAGGRIYRDGQVLTLTHAVMEGHRFAAESIGTGDSLLSWGLPFGAARRPITAGEYVCNHAMLDALGIRQLDFALPAEPNFEDVDETSTYRFDESGFCPGSQVALYPEPGHFQGYARGVRGVGTRNVVVVLGTSSRTASFARVLASRLQEAAADARVDGVVAVGHTEGGGQATPNNQELVLRTLAGFLVNPNVGAVLVVDRGSEPVNNRLLQDYMAARGYPLDQVLHRFLSLQGDFGAHLADGERCVQEWLDPVGRLRRSPQPLRHLKIALQCGGSDAFSGISANPLLGWAVREVIRHGGSANLAETDELMGAEPYILQNMRDLDTARRFLEMLERFGERVSWHGATAAANPSGGNKYRGLYNVTLKSIGAAMKRHPEVRVDRAIDYGVPMDEPGHYFMDSPGNDLESIAGQVACGCNLLFFTTGNGSVTNFPFVPTIKIVTTSQRFALLSRDMDVDAGAYLTGTPMDELGEVLFALTVEVASGQRTRGELAGHSQVSIWRNWPQQDGSQLASLSSVEQPSGERLPIQTETPPPARFTALHIGSGHAIDQVGLVLPTSLCSAQVAQLCAARLESAGVGRAAGVWRFVALPHTEGCGVSGGPAEHLFTRILLGYLTHPLVRAALFIEHGCEKTHNDFFRSRLVELGVDPERFGWASVQLDGGIDKVADKVEAYFAAALTGRAAPVPQEVGLECLHLGLASDGPVPAAVAAALARLTRWIVGGGGTVVVPENAPLLALAEYADGVLGELPAETSLSHGQRPEQTGFYIMEAPTDHWVETLSGLGATGVEMLLAYVAGHPVQGHPLLPLAQVSAENEVGLRYGGDVDLFLEGDPAAWAGQMLNLLLEVGSRRYLPGAAALGNADFQITRGRLGVSV